MPGMERSPHNLLSIGTFAAATQLSLKALRLYDQLAILKPTFIDPWTSYRYYSADQLRTATIIRLLRQMDMPLATIRSVLAASPADAEAMITAYRVEMEARVVQIRSIARDVVAVLHQEDRMTMDVQVRNTEPQHVVSITRRVKVDQLEDYIVGSIRTMNNVVDAAHVERNGAPFGIYHGHVDENEDGPVEVCLPVRAPVAVADGVAMKQLPAAQVAFVDITGEQCQFPAILQAYDAVYDWIKQNGYRHDGSPWEIYTAKDGSRMQIAWPFK